MYLLMRDHIPASGAVLFRHRSYLPFLSLPLLVYALVDSGQSERVFGLVAAEIVQYVSLGMIVLGQILRAITVGFVPIRTSGRNVFGQVAEVLNTTGLYSIVRNPLYLANCMMYVGIALLSKNILVALLFVALLVPYYERIVAAEEVFLLKKFGKQYEIWAERTPAFFPRHMRLVKPEFCFSIRTVIGREKASVLAAITGVYLMKLGVGFFGTSGEPVSTVWHWLFGVTVLGYICVKLIKKLGWLQVEGRI